MHFCAVWFLQIKCFHQCFKLEIKDKNRFYSLKKVHYQPEFSVCFGRKSGFAWFKIDFQHFGCFHWSFPSAINPSSASSATLTWHLPSSAQCFSWLCRVTDEHVACHKCSSKKAQTTNKLSAACELLFVIPSIFPHCCWDVRIRQ